METEYLAVLPFVGEAVDLELATSRLKACRACHAEDFGSPSLG